MRPAETMLPVPSNVIPIKPMVIWDAPLPKLFSAKPGNNVVPSALKCICRELAEFGPGKGAVEAARLG